VLESDSGRPVLGLDAPWTTLMSPISGCAAPPFPVKKPPHESPSRIPLKKIIGDWVFTARLVCLVGDPLTE
jgi:hypothetical protein